MRFSSHLSLHERLHQRSKSAKNGCRLWLGVCDKNGYGRLFWQGKDMHAHRLAWIDKHGMPSAKKPYVLHHCDTPSCINVGHLFLGTQADNVVDMMKKGRCHRVGRSGIENVKAKLTITQVKAIRRSKQPKQNIADEYDITLSHVWRIQSRRIWAHLH